MCRKPINSYCNRNFVKWVGLILFLFDAAVSSGLLAVIAVAHMEDKNKQEPIMSLLKGFYGDFLEFEHLWNFCEVIVFFTHNEIDSQNCTFF